MDGCHQTSLIVTLACFYICCLFYFFPGKLLKVSNVVVAIRSLVFYPQYLVDMYFVSCVMVCFFIPITTKYTPFVFS